MENGQTLCVLCHKKRTAEQKKRWAEERRRKRTRVEDEPAARHDDEKRHEKRPATDERPATADPVEIIIDEDDEDDEVISETESEGEARDARGGTEPAPGTQEYSGGTALFPDPDEDARDEPKPKTPATGGYLLSDDENSQDLMNAGLW